MTDYVVTGLVKCLSVRPGGIERKHERLRQMVLDLDNQDTTPQMFAPVMKIELIKPKAFRPPKDWAGYGEMTRVVLSILRPSAEPLTTSDIALQMLVERALDKSDHRLLTLMTKCVGVALRTQRASTVTQSKQGPGQYMFWEIAVR